MIMMIKSIESMQVLGISITSARIYSLIFIICVSKLRFEFFYLYFITFVMCLHLDYFNIYNLIHTHIHISDT
jgi:hypothetical protein